MGSNWDQAATARLLACVNHCVESDDNIDLKIEVPRLMAAQGDSRAWKSISAKLSSLNRLFSGPNKWDVKIHGSGALALDQELKTAIVAARKSIEAAETASNTNGELSAAATERPASRKRSRGDDGEGRLVSAPRKLRKTAVTRPEEMERLVEQENTAACEPKKEAGEVDRDATQQNGDGTGGFETAVGDTAMEASQTRQQALEQRIKELETDNKKKDDELTEYRDQLAVSAAAAANAGGEKNALLLWLQREKRAIEEQRKQDHEFHQLALDKLQTAFNQKESWYARIISRLDEVIGGQKMPAGGEAATDTQNGTPGCFNSSPPRDSRWIPSMSTPAPAVAPSEDRFATLTDIDIEYSPLGKTLSEAMDEEPSSNGVPLDTEPASRRQSYGIDENYSDGHDDEDDKPTSYNTRQSYDIDENYSDGHDDEYDGPTGHAAGQHTYPNDTNGDGDKEMSGEPDNNAHNSEDHEDTMGMTSFNIDFALADPQLARDILGESQIADTSEGHEFINQQLARHGVPTLASILGLGSILRQVTNSPSTSNDRHVEEYGNVDKDELPNATAQANAPQTPAQRARVPGDFRSSASRLEPPSSTWSSAVARGLITQNTPGMPGIQVIPPTPEQGGNDNADGRVGHSYHDETGHPEQPEENEGGDASETFQGSFDNAFPGYRYSDE